MASASVLAHVRLVPARRRHDTRASTEPLRPKNRPATVTDQTGVETTTPYARDYEPTREGRDSIPYCELEVTTERNAAPFDSGITTGRYVRPAKRPAKANEQVIVHPRLKPKATSQVKPAVKPVLKPAAKPGVRPDVKPDPTRDPELRPSARASAQDMSSLGVVLTPPQVGAALVIGSWLRPEFCVTSTVTHTSVRDGGVVVETASGSRYFVYYAGDAYVVRKL